jgi:hypothetical protein
MGKRAPAGSANIPIGAVEAVEEKVFSGAVRPGVL